MKPKAIEMNISCLTFSLGLLLSISQSAFTQNNEGSSVYVSDNETTVENKYLEYKFGASKIVMVKVVRGNGVYDISISDESGDSMKKIIVNDSEILDWAFLRMPSELKEMKYVIDESYSPFYNSLTFVDVKENTELCLSSKMDIIGDDNLNNCLKELKTYLVSIWYEELFYPKSIDSRDE